MTTRLFGIFCLLLLLLQTSFAQHRPIAQVTDVSRLDPARYAFAIYQGDSVALSITARRAGEPVDLTGGTFALWILTDLAATQLWMMATGTVSSATNGAVTVTAYPSQTLLPATQYLSQVRVFGVSDGKTNAIATVQYAYATVLPSGDVGASISTNVLPAPWRVTVNYYGEGGQDLSALSNNLLASYALASNAYTVATGAAPRSHTHAWSAITSTPTTLDGYGITDAYLLAWGNVVSNLARTAYNWGNHAAAGYATGSPVYVESDPVFAAYISTGVNAAVTNVYLSKLADVDTNGIQNGQVLVKQNEWWVPAAMVAATGGLYDGQWALTGRLSVTNPAALTSAALRVVNVLEVGNPQTGSGAPYFRTSGVIRIYKPDSSGPPSITIQAGFPGRSSDGDMIVITNFHSYSGVHIGGGTPAGANSTVVGGNRHGTYNAWCTYVGAPGGPTMGRCSAAFGCHNSMRVGDYAVSVGMNDGTECAVSNYATKIGAYTGVHGFYGFAAGYAARVYGHSNRLIGSYAIVTNGAGKTLVADKAVDARAVTNSFVVRGEMASLGGTSLCFYAGVIQTNIWGQPALTLTNGARPEWALEVSGTNLYFVAGGVRKRVVLEDL